MHVESLSSMQKTKLTFLDFAGNIKASTTINGDSYTWNIAQLKHGNYLLKIENGNSIVTYQFVKE